MDDGRIIELLGEGARNQAFNLMVRNYSERLYWHLRSMVHCHEDADDLLQNTWIRVWKAIDGFRNDSRLYTWLYRIATNEAITFLNRSKVKAALSFDSYSHRIAGRLEAEGHFDGDKIQLALQKAIAKLPARQKAVFTMRYYEEMPYEDMAEILGVTASSLKASYHHAHKKVTEALKAQLDAD